MLTKRYILKSSRLQHAYGENRPGFYDHDRSNLSGPYHQDSTVIDQISSKDKTENIEQKPISFNLKKDQKTGAHKLEV